MTGTIRETYAGNPLVTIGNTDIVPLGEDPGGSPADGGIAYSDLLAQLYSTLGDGWVVVQDAWAYASATTITVPSGAAALYSVGDKIKLTQTTVKYFYVVGVADTVLTVTGGSDYTVANAAITLPNYSKAATPLGFPAYFSYTPTGVSASNVTLAGRFTVLGRTCHCRIGMSFTGAITFTTNPTLPITASASILVIAHEMAGFGGYFDSGTAAVGYGVYPRITASATTCVIKNPAGTQMSATSPITWANADNLSVQFYYEI